ncbi:MAG: SDR family NAD(P)-dependent oxidoreductase [Alphaproteobacteria bacterium]|nr:SDR family NAD(P)-dependent oxidoreductase [Alphaproteobacteria bacterium]
MPGRLDGRVALVTGASRGIGRAVARGFAAEGARVVAVARTQGGLEELDDEIRALGGQATLVPMDLEKGEDIDRLGAAIHERFGRLDILVGNAGLLGRLSPLGHFPPRDWERVFAVNVHANWRLIRACDALLRASDAGRAIFVTSGAARKGLPYWGLYAATKAALEAMVAAYAAETKATSLRVNLVSPGAVRTAMRALAFPGEEPETVTPPEALVETFLALAEPGCAHHGRIVEAQPST